PPTRTLSIPVKHTTGRYFAPGLDPGQVVFRYAARQNPNGSQDDIAGVRNEAGNVVGLMPHPEHAVDPLTGSADGLHLFEPFLGAATGVGGILRDIFAIGARPIAVLDSLRFGEPTSSRSRYLLDRAVAGIGHYGNSVGVPTIGGEVYFEDPYETNCLINAMALGIGEREKLVRSAAAGVGT